MTVITEPKLRAWWSYRQALDGRLAGVAPAQVLEETGWARSVGGVGPYLTLFGRAGTSREATDKAVLKLDIHELPAARGCTYVVPARDFTLALKAGEAFAGGDMNAARKLGVTDREIEKLCDAVLAVLSKGPFEPDEIRKATGDASRKLGEEGKKKGISTTLPLALAKLQASGDIRRVSLNGRFDQQRYAYSVWADNPLAKCKVSGEEANVELARRYFSWIGPATLTEFRWFSALSVKDSKAAMERLELVSIDGDRMMLGADREEFQAFKIPKEPHYVLVSSLDGISLLRRDVKGLLEPGDRDRRFVGNNDAVSLGSLADLPSHAIFDRGRLIGVWEYDTAAETIVWAAFIPRNRELEKAVARTEEYVRTELGDARSFSLDSPKSRVPRIEALRAAAFMAGGL
jgi:hypothetical protein